MFRKLVVVVLDSLKFGIQLGCLLFLLFYFKLELTLVRLKLRYRGTTVSQFDFLLGKLLFKQSVLLRCLSQPLLKDRCGTVLVNGLFEELERIQGHGVLDQTNYQLSPVDPWIIPRNHGSSTQ